MVAGAALKLSVAFVALTVVEAQNRSLLNGRRLDTTATCTVHVNPYGTAKAAPWGTSTVVTCDAAKPGLRIDQTGTKSVTVKTATSAAAITSKQECCSAAPCSTGYIAAGTTAAGKTACPTSTVLMGSNLCLTANPAARTTCGNTGVTTNFDAMVLVDTDTCCKMPCSVKWQLNGAGDATKHSCDVGDFQVSTTAHCAKSTCDASTDKATCCQRKCNKHVVLFGETVTAPAQVACKGDTTDRISTTAFCTKSTCTATDTQCCQQKCGDGFVLFGTTDTGTSNDGAAKITCGEGLLLNGVTKDAYCAKTKCASSDAKLCCVTKCNAAKGFELFGGKTDGKFQCAKDLRVNPTGNCKGTDCKLSAAVCCQQKCTAGFKLKGATGTGTECGKDLTVHATAYCKGSSCGSSDAGTCCQQSCSKGFKLHGATTKESNTCAKDSTLASDIKCAGSPCSSTDSKLCCNEKCTDKKTGFKPNGGSGKEPNQCPKNEQVASKGMCAGDCSSDDAKTCCMKTENKTATTDAHSAGLASLVGVLLILSTAS